MSQDIKSPLTGNGSGADSQNQAGKWYQVCYEKYRSFTDLFHHEGAKEDGKLERELVFIPADRSIAKHVQKHVRDNTFEKFSFSRGRSSRWCVEATYGELCRKGYYGTTHVCFVVSITLFTSDGQMISDFKPKSIVKLFKDYVPTYKHVIEVESDDGYEDYDYDYQDRDED